MDRDDQLGILFAATTFLWSWGVLSIPMAMGLPFGNIIMEIAYVLAGAAPSVIALVFVKTTGVTSMRAFVQRILWPDLITGRGYAFILLFIPAVFAAALGVEAWLNARPPDWSILNRYGQDPFSLLRFAAFTMVFGPLAEEIGWRGYLLDRFVRRGPMVYGLMIGILWTLWHLPMFFITGTYQNSLLHSGALPVACFAFSTTAIGVLISQLVLKNKGSILAAVLFHFMVNFTGELIPLGALGNVTKSILLVVAACSILISNKKGSINSDRGRSQ